MWLQLVCRWTDPTSGEPRQSIARPCWPGVLAWLVLTFDGRPTDLRIETENGAGSLSVDRVEWLVSPP